VATTLALSVLFAAAASGAASTSAVVTARIPLNQTVKALVRGKFAQIITCRRSCKVIAEIFIPVQVARKLRFPAVTPGTPYALAHKQVKLAGGKPTRVYMRLGAAARKRLARWKKPLRLTGETRAEWLHTRVRGQASWISVLRQ